MLPPHWLDDVFADPGKAASALAEHKVFQAALAKAQQAFTEQQTRLAQASPGFLGPSPAQAARVAFIEALGLG
jgi:hypothetical protein